MSKRLYQVQVEIFVDADSIPEAHGKVQNMLRAIKSKPFDFMYANNKTVVCDSYKSLAELQKGDSPNEN